MPSGRDALRNLFMRGDDDGILLAKEILREAGYGVNCGYITVPDEESDDPLVAICIEYLLDEWDYNFNFEMEEIPNVSL